MGCEGTFTKTTRSGETVYSCCLDQRLIGKLARMEVWQLGGSEQVCHRNDRTVLFFTRVCLLAALARRYKGKISVRSIIVSRTLHTNIIQPSFSRLWHYDRTITSSLHVITGQVCRGETPGRLWMSLVAFPSCRLKPCHAGLIFHHQVNRDELCRAASEMDPLRSRAKVRSSRLRTGCGEVLQPRRTPEETDCC